MKQIVAIFIDTFKVFFSKKFLKYASLSHAQGLHNFITLQLFIASFLLRNCRCLIGNKRNYPKITKLYCYMLLMYHLIIWVESDLFLIIVYFGKKDMCNQFIFDILTMFLQWPLYWILIYIYMMTIL